MRLLYFFDPLCGWSYAFHPVMKKVQEHYPNIPISFICGGMIVGAREGQVGDRGQFYLNILPRLSSMANVPFGDVYKRKLEDGTFFNSSIRPSVAVNIVNSVYPHKTIDFIEAMFHRIFVHGDEFQDIIEIETAAIEAEIDASAISEQFADPRWMELTKKDFELTASIGISGFPTLVAEVNDKLYLVNQGYTTLENAVLNIDELAKTEVPA